MNKFKLSILLLLCCILFCACSSAPAATQTRNDLTEEHFRGLYSDMNRSDVQDLIGQSDPALGQNESVEMYSLADGTTALLRYAGDKLQAAYIRGKDNIERTLFSNYSDQSSNTINDGTTDQTNDSNNSNNNNNNGDPDASNSTGSDNNSNNTNNGNNSDGLIPGNDTNNGNDGIDLIPGDNNNTSNTTESNQNESGSR